MTITQAMQLLESLKKHHGGQVEIYFDCPRCGSSFSPDKAITQGLHMSARPEVGNKQKA